MLISGLSPLFFLLPLMWIGRLLKIFSAFGVAVLVAATLTVLDDRNDHPVANTFVTDVRAQDLKSPIKVGVVEFVRPSPNESIVDATIEALRQRFGRDMVQERAYSMEDLTLAIQNHGVDIFLSSAGFYWRTTRIGGVSIGSLASYTYPNPNRGEASAFVVRSDSPYEKIADLKGTVASVATTDGFTSYMIPMGEIERLGFDHDKFFSRILVTGSGSHSSTALDFLRTGATQVALLRQCWLEEWLERHPDDADRFRVLAPREITPDERNHLVCRRSTDMYPAWVVATTPATPPEISKAATQAIFAMPPTPEGQYWSVGTDYRGIDNLYRALQMGPYAYLREWTFERVWQAYSTPILAFLVLVFGWLWHSIRVTRLVQVRTAELKDALEREKELKILATDTSERIARLQRVGIVGQISSMIAHELRQPMGAMSLYITSARRLLKREAIDKVMMAGILDKLDAQTKRANSIIDNVRGYAKGKKEDRHPTNLREVIRLAVDSWKGTGRLPNVEVVSEADTDIWFEANALEWEIVVLNLIKNAAEASFNVESPLVVVGLEKTGPFKARLTVSDNGPGMTQEEFEKFGAPLESGKSEGMGLGLSIVRGIVEAHGSRIHFVRNRTAGMTAVIDVELRQTTISIEDIIAARRKLDPADSQDSSTEAVHARGE